MSCLPPGIDCGSDCSEPFTYGTTVALTPVASGGSYFVGWAGDSDCADGSILVDRAVACSANFGSLGSMILVDGFESWEHLCLERGVSMKTGNRAGLKSAESAVSLSFVPRLPQWADAAAGRRRGRGEASPDYPAGPLHPPSPQFGVHPGEPVGPSERRDARSATRPFRKEWHHTTRASAITDAAGTRPSSARPKMTGFHRRTAGGTPRERSAGTGGGDGASGMVGRQRDCAR